MYTVRLRSVGNPDFQQYAPISEPVTEEAETLGLLWQKCEEYIRFWNLGGGNWVDPKVTQDGKVIGYFSYNGRLWSIHKSAVNPQGTEIVYGRAPEKSQPKLLHIVVGTPMDDCEICRAHNIKKEDFNKEGGTVIVKDFDLHDAVKCNNGAHCPLCAQLVGTKGWGGL